MNLEERIRLQLEEFSSEIAKAENQMEEQRAYGKVVGFLIGVKIAVNEKLVERACIGTGFDALFDTLEP